MGKQVIGAVGHTQLSVRLKGGRGGMVPDKGCVVL